MLGKSVLVHMKLIDSTKMINRRLALARRAAMLSTHPEQRHGALVVKGGSIISVGCNHCDFSKHAGLSRDYNEYSIGSLHAEISALRGLSKDVTQGSTVYVVRIGKSDGLFRISAPCAMCVRALYNAGVKRVIFSVDAARIGMMTPKG